MATCKKCIYLVTNVSIRTSFHKNERGLSRFWAIFNIILLILFLSSH